MSSERRFIRPRHGAAILGLQLMLLLFRLGDVPLLGPDEPRYARVAVEMARTNSFVTPTLAGVPWLEKPPLYYWLAGFAYRVFGENEFAARLPAVLAALILTGWTGLLGARLFGESVGRTAMMIAATSPLLFAYGRVATMDMLVAAFSTIAAGTLLLRLLEVNGPGGTGFAWAAMSLAFLAKGPIGFLLPLGSATLFMLLDRKAAIGRVANVFGLAVGFALSAPWVIAILRARGTEFIDVFLLNHNIQRFTSTIHNHPGPFYYYAPVLLLGVLPWSGLVAPAVAATADLDVRPRRALLAWAAVPLLLFSIAGSKLPGYILPCVPPLAILLAVGARRLGEEGIHAAGRVGGLIGLVTGALAVGFTVRGIRTGEVWARNALMPALWLLATLFMASVCFDRRKREVVRILQVSAAGFLLILTLVAPPVLDAMESGRRLFIPARGREVLVLGAWRTAWMAGYFYNDGQVREIESLREALPKDAASTLVLLGPDDFAQAQRLKGFALLRLAQGPRGTVLVRVSLEGVH